MLFASHAWTGALRYNRDDTQHNFAKTLRFDLNPARERANTSLTALARFAQWTGFYMLGLVALFLSGSFTNPLIMCAAMHNLPLMTSVTPKI